MVSSREATQSEKAFAFLAILFASLPDKFYSADAGEWSSAILSLRDKYGSKYTELFRHLHFRRAPRADTYSPEVSNFLTFLQFTDATVVHNPGFTKMQLQETARQILRDSYQALLEAPELAGVEQMSQELAETLKRT